MRTSRRRVLQSLGAASLLAYLPRPLGGQAPPPPRRSLLLFLDGGNDGLNTVVPFADPRYRALRPRLALSGELPALDAATALHPALAPWRPLFERGRLAVLRAVGYERPDRSHFVSRDIWHCGRREAPYDTGWVARALEHHPALGLPAVAVGGGEAPLLLRGRRAAGWTVDHPSALAVEGPARVEELRAATAMAGEGAPARLAAAADSAYTAAEDLRRSIAAVALGEGYPESPLGAQLQFAARLLRAPLGPPLVWCSLGGFDTHAVQAGTHAALLGQLAAATAAFVHDLERDATADLVLTLIYSEFGRRAAENGSAGTDHGAAGPVFALGPVRGGLYGAPPDFDALVDGDLPAQTDFRAVWSQACAWMGWDAAALFPGYAAAGGPAFVNA